MSLKEKFNSTVNITTKSNDPTLQSKPKDWYRRNREPKYLGEKKCASCPNIKPLTKFAINRSNKDGRRTICKVCFAYRQNCVNAFKAAEKNPDNYMMCNSCDRIFRKRSLFKCRYCGSTDIEEY